MARPLVEPVLPPAVVSASAAPVLLVGGWFLAQTRRPAGYVPARDTISALASRGAPDRWIVTSAFIASGACHFVSALGLRGVHRGGRVVLGMGGVASILIGVFPLSAGEGAEGATLHKLAAATAFTSLGAWPAFAGRRSPSSQLIHPLTGWLAASGLLGTMGWFLYELGHGKRAGAAERVATTAQALWPLIVVVSLRRTSGQRRGRGRFDR